MDKLKPCPFCGSPAGKPNMFDRVPCSNPDWNKCNMANWAMPVEQWQNRPGVEQAVGDVDV